MTFTVKVAPLAWLRAGGSNINVGDPFAVCGADTTGGGVAKFAATEVAGAGVGVAGPGCAGCRCACGWGCGAPVGAAGVCGAAGAAPAGAAGRLPCRNTSALAGPTSSMSTD